MTKGKIVLELIKYAKSAIKNFDQSEASIQSHMTTISKKILKKNDFQSNVYKFFSCWHKDNVHNEQF